MGIHFTAGRRGELVAGMTQRKSGTQHEGLEGEGKGEIDTLQASKSEKLSGEVGKIKKIYVRWKSGW